MLVVVINDNTRRLFSWEKQVGADKVKTFSHPNYLLTDLLQNPESFKDVEYYIFDRIFYGQDLFKDPVFGEIKKVCPNKEAKFVLSSAHHVQGETVPGFDFVIAIKPTSLEELVSQAK